MSRTKYLFCLSLLATSASLLIASHRPIALIKPTAIRRPAAATNQSRPLSIPLTFEANRGASASRNSIPRPRASPLDLPDPQLESKSSPSIPAASRNTAAPRITGFKSPSRALPEAPTAKLPIAQCLRHMEGNRPTSRPNQLLHRKSILRNGAQPFPITPAQKPAAFSPELT